MIITKKNTRNNPWNHLYISKVKKMTEGGGGGGGEEGGNGEKFLNCNYQQPLQAFLQLAVL